MEIYLVGGAVRDGLLGLPVKDRDWVVVGGDDRQMRERGFERMDAAFPVYREPSSGDEYALARRETKRGQGYRGFVVETGPEVTLEQDLRRRDLTVNAMAQAADGSVFDPFGGRKDLDDRLLRHVSPAFVEDPVRVLRLARFAALLAPFGFRVAQTTEDLLRQMTASGELDSLTPERFTRELNRALATDAPWRFFEVLHRCRALGQLLPPLDLAMGDVEAFRDDIDPGPVTAMQRICGVTLRPAARLAAALLDVLSTESDLSALELYLRLDRDTTRFLRRLMETRPLVDKALTGEPESVYELLVVWRGLSDSREAADLAAVIDAQAPGRQLARIVATATEAALGVSARDAGAVGMSGESLGRALAGMRRRAVAEALRREPPAVR